MTSPTPIPVKPPIETKVNAATVGAGSGVVIAQAILWILDQYVFGPGKEGDVPGPVTILVTVAVSAALAWVAGYRAKHTPRPDLGTP